MCQTNPTRLVQMLALATLLTAATWHYVIAAEEKGAAPASQEIQRLIVELDDDDYKVREHATRRLAEIGRPAIEPVARALSTGSLEVITRATTVLEKIYRRGDDETVDAVEAVFETLTQHKNQSVAGRAEMVLVKCYPLRERRAIAEIRKAGGVFYRDDVDNKETVVTEAGGLSYDRLLLHLESWTAGDEGLRHIKRLTRLRSMRFVPKVSGISADAIRDLQAAMPELSIHERGAAKLGLTGQPSQNPKGCQITRIEPGSAADEAKLRVDDIIVSFENNPVPDFDTLVEMIKQKKPGDKVTMEVQRLGEAGARTVTPVLKGWKP